MDAKFLELYNQELKFIRESGAEFAKEYPKIAGRLGLEGFDCSDPYVERLLEGFAFLSARIHHKLDASFPEFTQHLLELLFPTFLQPLPSMIIAQFNPDYDEGSLLNGVDIPKNTSLFSQLGKEEQTACEYKTSHAVTLWPVKLVKAEYINSQDLASFANNGQTQHQQKYRQLPQKSAKSAIKITLEAPPGLRFSDISMNVLNLHIRGAESFPLHIYQALYKGFCGLMYKSGDTLWRPAQDNIELRARGMTPEEALLPFCNRQFDGFRLLREYFAFSQRFLFLDLANIQSSLALCNQEKIELLILLDHAQPRLENLVSKENFALHCSPAINLFPKRAERINVSRKSHDFHVVPDKLRPLDFEVCSITDVKGLGSSVDTTAQLLPLYGSSNSSSYQTSQRQAGYYTASRINRTLSVNQRKFGHRSSYVGSEVYLSIVDPKAAPYSADLMQLAVQTMCCNRDLPLMMPLGKGNTDFTIDTGAPCTSVRCVGEPTRPMPPLNQGDTGWDLINQLSINFLGFGDEEEGLALDALKRLLSLMTDKNSHTQAKQIDGIIGMTITKITGRLPFGGPICFARGIEVGITLDETAYQGNSAFMLGMVLDQFFAQYVGTNSFSKLVLHSSNRTEIHQWPIRIGSRSAI